MSHFKKIIYLTFFCHLATGQAMQAQDDTWQKTTDPDHLREACIDPVQLEQFGRWNVEHTWGGTSMMPRSFLLIRNGAIIGEWYADEFGNHRPEEAGIGELARLSSAGKTYALLLTGILLEQRQLWKLPEDFSTAAKLYDTRWLPLGFPLSDPAKAEITVEHVLRHVSGIMPESGGNDRGGLRSSTAFTLGKEGVPPLARKLYFAAGLPASYLPASPYSSVAFNHLGLVFRNLTGKPAAELLEELLLKPLGIEAVGYSAQLEDRDAGWLQDDVTWFTSGGLWLSPRDHARLGWLIANNGRWNGRQVVPQSWLHSLTVSGEYPDLLVNRPGRWTNGDIRGAGARPLRPGMPDDLLYFGEPGMCVTYCIPSRGLVAVRTGRIVGVDWETQEEEFLDRLMGLFPEQSSVRESGHQSSDDAKKVTSVARIIP
jgi:hypothetical protein